MNWVHDGLGGVQYHQRVSHGVESPGGALQVGVPQPGGELVLQGDKEDDHKSDFVASFHGGNNHEKGLASTGDNDW